MFGRIVTLDPADDAPSACDRIEWAHADRVVMVMPQGMRWREIDFAHVQRAGRQSGVEVAIVSDNLTQRQAARDVGLVVFGSVEDAINKQWLASEDVQALQRQSALRRFKPNSLRRFFPRRNWFLFAGRALVTLVTAAIIAACVVAVLPHAEITLTASSQTISTIVPVTLDPQASEVNAEARTIPAQRIDVIVEDRLTTDSTGKKSIPAGKARGFVTFSNILTTPYAVPRNTVVRTTATSVPARFVTLSDVEVPPGGRADVAVQAIDEGPGGNVGANQINRVEGVPSLAVNVINANATAGGGNVDVRAVTEEDYARLRAELRTKLLATAAERMQQDRDVVNGGLIVLPETLFIADVQDETYDRFITEQSDNVSLNLRYQVAGLAISPRDLETISRDVLRSKVPEGFQLLTVESARGDVAEEGTGNDTLFYVNARGTAGAEISESAVKRLVRGKSPAEAQAALLQGFALRRNPQITTGPDWLMQYLNRLPWVTLRINTTVERE
jgi:hypothetical protein